MKTVDELGISPMPWRVGDYDKFEDDREIRCDSTLRKNGSKVVAECNYHFPEYKNDARLISAAPELYDCLRSATIAECRGCTHKSDCHDYIIPCPIRRWRKALAKASGEEVE